MLPIPPDVRTLIAIVEHVCGPELLAWCPELVTIDKSKERELFSVENSSITAHPNHWFIDKTLHGGFDRAQPLRPPFPSANPSALTTIGAPFSSIWALASSKSECAIGCCRNIVTDHDFLSKILGPLQLRCNLVRPKALRPAWLKSHNTGHQGGIIWTDERSKQHIVSLANSMEV